MNTLIVLLILLYIIHLSLAFRRISPPRIQYESTKSLDHDNCRYYKLYSTTDNENIQSTPIETLKSKLRGTNVYFIGMMGSGKTTVSDLLTSSSLVYYLAYLLGCKRICRFNRL